MTTNISNEFLGSKYIPCSLSPSPKTTPIHAIGAEKIALVVEHHLDVIKCADWVIDLGPGGGDSGGHIVAQGQPEDIAKDQNSITGQYLKSLLFQI